MTERDRRISQAVALWLRSDNPQDPDWSPDDWQALKTIARVHGVGPLLHQRLAGAAFLPTEIRVWLADQYRYNRHRVSRMHADLQTILAAFAGAGVAVMPLKGSLLSARHYADPALRPMADLDLLVRPADRTAAETCLTDLGYRRLSANWKHTEWGRPGNMKVVSTEFEHPENPRKLDLHVSVGEMLAGPTVDITSQLWQGASSGRLLGEPAVIPNDDSLWLHLLLHVNGEIWGLTNRLVHLYDLSLVPAPERLPAIDPRFTYMALRLLADVFPGGRLQSLLAASSQSLSSEFIEWAGNVDIHSSSFLGRDTAQPYFERLQAFYSRRSGSLLWALRFMLLPQGDEVRFEAGPSPTVFALASAWGRILSGKISAISKLF